MQNFTKILKHHFEKEPERVCLVILQSNLPDLSITYRELLHGSAGYAETYKRDGIVPGDVLVLILQHGIDLVYAYFGAILSGVIPSIMPFLTEKLLPEKYRSDLASLICITRPAGIVTYREFEQEVRSALVPEDSVRNLFLSHEIDPPCIPDFNKLPGLNRNSADIVLLQHSSGTTGLQKGVALSHQAVLNQLDSYGAVLGLKPEEDVIVSWLPLYHDMGLIACFILPILLKVPLVLLSPFDWIRAPYRLLQAVSAYKGTLSWLPNFAYNFCALKIRDRNLDGVDLSSWRAIINCSEPMYLESHVTFFNRFKDLGLKYEALATCYAMAENVFAVTQGGIGEPVVVDKIDRESIQLEKTAKEPIVGKPSVKLLSAGKPIPGVQVKIVDIDGKILPDRKIGEIILLSNCMLTGYYNRPDVTQKSFLREWYLTGDYGYSVDGQIFVTGRKKDLIIVGGKNVYPQDIEQLAMEVADVHPGRVVVFGVFNDDLGTEDVVLIAEVDSEDKKVRERISDQIRQTVTRGSAIALRQVVLVGEKWLIKTSSGKVARHANREKYLKEFE
jgi:acyl-CoA synthetase (AMP-forming)/AMP-acid ligase II